MAEQVIISNGHITAEISAIGAEIKSINYVAGRSVRMDGSRSAAVPDLRRIERR